MDREEFDRLIRGRFVLLDGATGTNLLKRGMPRGASTELWALEHPDIVRNLARDYAEAGSEILIAPTFGANRKRLAEHGAEDRVAEITGPLVAIAKDAAGSALVAGDMSPTGMIPESIGGEDDEEEIFDIYAEQADALKSAGVDLIVIETMLSVTETVIAAKTALETGLPVLATMTVDQSGHALFDGTVFDAAEKLAPLGVSAVGINCSSGPDTLSGIILELKKHTDLPVIAKPNAGIPKVVNGVAEYDMDEEAFVRHMQTLKEDGASLLGGCCGTSPSYIRLMREKLF